LEAPRSTLDSAIMGKTQRAPAKHSTRRPLCTKVKALHACTHCEKTFKTKQHLKTHLAYIHEIDVTWHPCTHCKEKFKEASTLKTHLAYIHEIDVTWHPCTHCKEKFKEKSSLKKHLAYIHDLDVTWHPCTHCKEKFKVASTLKTHLADVHDIDVTWHACTHCKKKFKQQSNLKKHMENVHDIDVTWHPCTHCEEKFKQKSSLKTHLACVHDIDVTWHPCTHCKEKFKQQCNLKTHLAFKHNIDVTWHPCTHCKEKFKKKSSLKTHSESVHDIGRHKCAYCHQNRNSSLPYQDAQLGEEVQICRACFNKVTGKVVNSRIELWWRERLEQELGTAYLLGCDKSLRGLGGCSLKRPDWLATWPEFVELGECDEKQHTGHNGDYRCEEERLSEIYDEPSICGRKLVVLRWNPDGYTPPAGQTKVKGKEKRMAIYLALHRKLRQHPPSDLITVYYLFYSEDNPRICRQYPARMINSMADVEAL
jgi:hypothetical protein